MKRISRRNFLKAMGISATALTLAACGGSSSSTAASTAGSSAASAAATGEPKAGGTLRLCYGNPIATPGYTPRATGNALLFYLNLAYENLLTYDNDGNMVPKLATEWDVNNDENSITWTLRENVKFADGEPFNAEAVKRNIEEYQANNRTETANIAECQIIDCSATSFLRNWDSILEKKRANLRSISEPARLRQPPPQKHGSGTRKRAGSKHSGGATNSRPSRAFCPLVG
jgi:peptide/nickel transport system substrate-binding protein